ncbi:CMP-N-acetylneuraminate-beta-galactosamide-alpha-2,3-sialyltransferase 1 isoform X2 [Rhinoderma darwinii]|uniref:CMP-N-acetylneuraminate-beta-galactosamide- alpha-2,3-sialyltransferase 1 isoform X2 n=1 Tax=Rhinoderma darwinii TaxID=43563 RepID=UPI003F666B86
MVALKHRNLKLFTIALALFAITIMSFLLNYTQNSGLVLWNPEKYFRFSGPFIRFITSVRRPCSCETCVSETEISQWFDERFNYTFSPLLTKQNNVVSENTYTWWMKLQGEKKPMDINQAIEEMFKVIPGDNNLLNPNPYRCRTCAVVGNSGNLKGSDYGPDIDSHNFVLSTYAPVPRKIKVTKDQILVYHPDFMKYIYDKWLFHHGRYPSTGILSVIFALHVCDQVDLYGFGADSKGNWHHYWENNPSAGAFRQTGVHDGDFEAEIIGNLTSINKIKVYGGR